MTCCNLCCDAAVGSMAVTAVSLSVSVPGAVLGSGVVVGTAIVTTVGASVVAPGGSNS